MQDDGVKRPSFNRRIFRLKDVPEVANERHQPALQNTVFVDGAALGLARAFLLAQARAKNARSSSEICQLNPTNLAKRHRRRRAPRSSRQSRAALLMFNFCRAAK
jgi:hypothetical protein